MFNQMFTFNWNISTLTLFKTNKYTQKIMTKKLLDISNSSNPSLKWQSELFTTDFHWSQWVAIIHALNRLNVTSHCNANKITVHNSHAAKADK